MGWINDLVLGGHRIVNAAGTALTMRSKLVFTGDGVVLTDDADGDRTVATFAGGEGAPEPYDLDFTNAGLVADVLTVTHALDRKAPKVSVFDASGSSYTLPITRVSSNQVTIDFTGLTPISGTWSLSVI